MEKENLTDIQLHSAGATVRHNNPFEELVSYVNEVEITQGFREEWVIPFYFELNNKSDEWIEKMIQLKSKINEEIILQNLGDFDWRTRSTGSYFAAIKKSTHLENIIGTHLLKSEVCYAGSEYALTLASFNTPKSVDFFDRYLQYYLKQPQLYFDQGSVITALKYLDEVNKTNNTEKHLKNWQDCLLWRDKAQVENLKNLKNIVPEKSEDIDKQIEELKPQDSSIDTDNFHQSIESLNRIINE
jgi:tetratricopeptide (TPR) repeat protein